MLPMKIYPDLSYCREIHETDVNYTYNLQWIDSSVSLNGTRGSLFIFIRSTIPMISGDFLTQWNGSQVSRTGQYGTNDKGKLKHSSVHAILFLAYVEIRPFNVTNAKVGGIEHVCFIKMAGRHMLFSLEKIV